ncbi:MAG: hypothetical protein P4L68_01100 [Methylovirgula sp.]|nr:hypothetical protein [Methylovirgula sp.]
MTACSYTPAEIDEMTLFDVANLFAYWRETPPAHEILKCVYRIAPKPAAEPNAAGDPSGIGALIARFPDGQVKQT